MLFKKFNYFLLPLVVFFLFLSKSIFAENKLLMITADYCIFCQIWEKEIGNIYPKTDISKSFPLEKIELDEYLFNNDINDNNIQIVPRDNFNQATHHTCLTGIKRR